MSADELRDQIKRGEKKLEGAKAKAAAMPKSMTRLHLEHLINGAERGLDELRCLLIEKESSLF